MTTRLPHLLLLAALGAGCGSTTTETSTFDGGSDGSGGSDRDGTTGPGHDSGKIGKDGGVKLGSPDVAVAFAVTPTSLQTLTVKVGASSPTETYKATANGGPANATWSVDRPDIGTIAPGPASTGVLVPTGTTGGIVTLTVAGPGQTLTRQVLVKLTATQSGPNASAAEMAQVPTTVAQLSALGGVGGVGGEGLGVAVTDPAALAALANPTGDAGSPGLTFLYPYDKTVWPRGMIAPLLMWSWGPGDADAIQIELATGSGSFSWTGTFGRPAILSMTGGPYIRSPIPQDVWDMATNTAGALTTAGKPDPLIVKLTVEKGGVGAGPITETWPVAPGRLTGTVYYNSYGTHFVKNWVNADGAGNAVGAAILGIASGATAPTLVVGQNSPLNASGFPTDDTGCRVCHVVSSHGRWLLTQSEQGNPGDGQSYLYDLSQTNVQGSALAIAQQGVFGWAAMVGDGSYALTNSIDPSSTNPALGGTTSSFWQFAPTPAASAGTLNGLPAGVAAGYPSYAPDDKQVAYVDVTGQTTNVDGPINTAQYDVATQTFSNVQTVAMPATGQRIGYPVFLPDDSGLIFETEVRSSNEDSVMVTRNGARSELWWVKLGATPTPVRLDVLNGNSGGTSYLPTNANNHGTSGASDPESSYSEVGFDDTTLNYEPTVLPLVAGGYAWVVFTSRRLYGNQLTAVPWLSWPPDYDTTSLAQATVKKLWVAAIDLSDPASSDISHPAFYLPAQEILAGNSRGFWVLDPCEPDGQSCQTGDQCCNGYCEANGDGGALICSSTTPHSCSLVQEKCTTAGNCCDTSNICADGFCAIPGSK